MINGKKIFAVVPAYNEEKSIGKVVRGCKSYVDKVIVVDDASSDKTSEIAKKSGAKVLKHKVNQGVGAAIRDGFFKAIEEGADIMVVLAGDNQMDPKDIPNVVKPLIGNRADFVKGTRFRRFKPTKYGMPIYRYFGTGLLSLLTRILTGYSISDSNCGYVAISKQTVKDLNWKLVHQRYVFENSILANLSILKKRVVEADVKPIYKQSISKMKMRTFIPSALGVFIRLFIYKLGYKKLKRI